MATMAHFGIRYEEDLTHICSDYIIESVDLLNAQLSHHGMNFFFDMADVDQQVIGGKHCWDMFGWVVPTESIGEFEHIWLASKDDALEKYDYVCASWEDRDGFPHAVIDGELPEEAYE